MDQFTQISSIFEKQKIHYQQNPYPCLNERLQQLKNLKRALLEHQQQLVDALSADYGYRSTDETLLADLMPVVSQINYTLKQLKSWLKPSRRHSGLLLFPAKIKVHYQPIGIVGIIVPWNFPVMLSLGPLVSNLAAGNHAMIKLSEFTPATNAVIKKLLSAIFIDSQVAIIEGKADVGAQFAAQPFDHLIFTGSTHVGHQIMAAAAKNLTPVTLELGGKSPVIITENMPINIAVERMIYGKCLNAGQICIAPDYVLCHHSQVDAFIEAYQSQFSAMYGQVTDNPDYTNIINERQYQRLMTLLNDAVDKGAKVHSASADIMPKPKQNRQLATHLITQTTDDMLIMQQEIFGPLLPIISYDTLEQAIDYINQRPRPLALYLMSFDPHIQQQVITNTHSGGVCINDTVKHVAAEDAPFGGIGMSGIGHYHGKEGFLRFSHAKTVLSRGHFNTGKLIHPPFGKWWHNILFHFFIR